MLEAIEGYDNWKLASPPESEHKKCDGCFFYRNFDCDEADNFDYDGCDYYNEDNDPPIDDYPDWVDVENEEEENE